MGQFTSKVLWYDGWGHIYLSFEYNYRHTKLLFFFWKRYTDLYCILSVIFYFSLDFSSPWQQFDKLEDCTTLFS